MASSCVRNRAGCAKSSWGLVPINDNDAVSARESLRTFADVGFRNARVPAAIASSADFYLEATIEYATRHPE